MFPLSAWKVFDFQGVQSIDTSRDNTSGGSCFSNGVCSLTPSHITPPGLVFNILFIGIIPQCEHPTSYIIQTFSSVLPVLFTLAVPFGLKYYVVVDLMYIFLITDDIGYLSHVYLQNMSFLW